MNIMELIMILFSEDWELQRAVVHKSTKNPHFLRMAVLLNKMGIKNNLFFLALHQPDLAEYDPHDLKDNSVELRQRIAYECKINPWYFLRECVRVVGGSPFPLKYALNRANCAMTWTFLNSIDQFTTQPRQVGKTIGSIAIYTWLMYIGGTNINIGLFAKAAALVQENVSRLKLMRDSLPKYLVYPTPADTNNKEGVAYAALNNKYLTFCAQSDKRAAADTAKGQSLISEHWDEMAAYDNNKLAYQSAIPATGAAQPLARSSGIPCANIFTTTAGKLSDPRGLFAYGLKSKALRFTEKLYDTKNRDHLLEVVKTNSAMHMLYLEYSYKQLGKTDEWLAERTRGMNREEIETDYLNIWQLGTENSAIPKHLVDRLSASVCEPITTTFFETLAIRWYIHPNDIYSEKYKDRPYIIGCDTSDNVGVDFTTLVMLDPSDLSLVATLKCNKSNLVYVSECITNFLIQLPRSIFIPERNKNGAFIIDQIILSLKQKGINPITRIYNLYIQDHNENTPAFHTLDYESGLVRKNFGFNTTGASRDMLFKQVLMPALELNADKLCDPDLVDEARGLCIRNGRIDHNEGSHDDLIIAYLLAVYFVIYGRNLHMYGIRNDEVLNSIDELTGNQIDPLEKQRLQQARNRIAQLEKLISQATSPLVKTAYEREYKFLKSTTPEATVAGTLISVDQVTKENAKNAPTFSLGSENSIRVLKKLL